MALSSDPKVALLEQNSALNAYFDDLLRAGTRGAEPGPALPEAPMPPPAALKLVSPAQTGADAVPSWGEGRFACLLFHVGALKLAVPLVRLTRILPWEGRITRTPGSPPWLLGLLAGERAKARVIDTGRLVFPRDRRSQATGAESRGDPTHILLVEDGRWGLTCDALGEIVELESAEVRWRTLSTARPWLAGTMLNHMCALLDVRALAHIVGDDAGPPMV